MNYLGRVVGYTVGLRARDCTSVYLLGTPFDVV
jgi:hypothetical protein